MDSKKLQRKLKLKTGLHVGDIQSIKIGGLDSPVVKDTYGLPYIPGSSLKGKLRYICNKYFENIEEELFGKKKESGGKDKSMGSLIIRDSFVNIEETIKNLELDKRYEYKEILKEKNFDDLDEENKFKIKNLLKKDLFELKPENTISNGKAVPRFIERVRSGVIFDVEIIIRKVDNNYNLEEHENKVKEIMKKLSEIDYLGGSGTRGYGFIEFIE